MNMLLANLSRWEWKQQVRDARPVQRRFCMEYMLACIAFRYPRAPRSATNPESLALQRSVRVPVQSIHSLHADSSFGCLRFRFDHTSSSNNCPISKSRRHCRRFVSSPGIRRAAAELFYRIARIHTPPLFLDELSDSQPCPPPMQIYEPTARNGQKRGVRVTEDFRPKPDVFSMWFV